MKGLVFLACLMLLLAAPVAFAYDGWSVDDWTYDTGSSSSCCCGPTFILAAGAALFTYAHQKK